MQAPLALGQPAGFRWPPSWHLLVRRPWAGHLTRLRRVSKKREAARRGRCGLKTTSVRCVCTPMCPQASVALCSRRGTDCVLAGQLQSVASGQCVSVRPAKPRSRRPIPPADGLSPPCPAFLQRDEDASVLCPHPRVTTLPQTSGCQGKEN